MIEFYKRGEDIFEVHDAGIVKRKIDESEVPKGAKVIENLQEKEEDNKIPTEEGALFEHKGTIFIIKNGTAVRATENEIQKYYEQLQIQKNLENT